MDDIQRFLIDHIAYGYPLLFLGVLLEMPACRCRARRPC